MFDWGVEGGEFVTGSTPTEESAAFATGVNRGHCRRDRRSGQRLDEDVHEYRP